MERIDKVLSYSLGASRKEIKLFLSKGRVKLNGKVIKKSDLKINPLSDELSFDGRIIPYKKNTYLMLNKPKGFVSATEDKSQKTVLELVPRELFREGLFPAGRLDKETTGFVLLTDDGDLAHEILSPKKHVTKEYIATVDGLIDQSIINSFKNKIELKNGDKCLEARLIPISCSRELSVGRVIIKQGMYHQVRRMFASVGLKVLELKRVRIGSLPLDESLAEGEIRELSPEELELLKLPSEEYDF